MFRHPALEYYGKAGKANVSFVKGENVDRQAILAAIANPAAYAERAFKDDFYRLIFRLETTQGPVLVKHFRLPRLKDKVKCWQFAPDEFALHIAAQSTGIHCPKILAFYETRFLGMNRSQGLIYQFLDGFREITDDEVDLAAQALLGLYRAGVNHADFIRTNVLHNDTTGEGALIDFERSSLVKGERSRLSLLMQTQRFLEFGERPLEDDHSQRFLRLVWEGTQADINLSWEDFLSVIRILRQRHRKRKELRGLILPQEALDILNAKP